MGELTIGLPHGQFTPREIDSFRTPQRFSDDIVQGRFYR
jgi:hypothetical protein